MKIMIKQVVTDWVGGCGGAVHKRRVRDTIDDLQNKGFEVYEIQDQKKGFISRLLGMDDDVTNIYYRATND